MNAQDQESGAWRRNLSPSPIGVQPREPRRAPATPNLLFEGSPAQAQKAAVSLVKMLEPIAVEARG